MATYPQTFSANNKYTLTLTVTEQGTNISTNQSTLAYSLVMATAANSFVSYSDYRTTISCTINNTVVYSYNAARNFNYPGTQSSYTETLCSGTILVTHNDDGSYTCPVAASVSVASGDYSPGSASISDNLVLSVIPRASTCSWSGDFTIDQSKNITITRATGTSFNHKLKFTVGSATETVPPGGTYATTSYSWTPAKATYSGQFPTQTVRTGTLVLYTYNSGTLIGSNTYSFNLKIPNDWVPSVGLSLTPYPDNAWLIGKSYYVQNNSAITAKATGTAATGAQIASYTFSGALSKTVNTTASSTVTTSSVITTSGTKSVTVKITDKRGRTATATQSVQFQQYAYPAISSISYARGSYVGGTWTSSNTGEDLKVTFTATCSLSGTYGNYMSYSAPQMTVNSSGTMTSGQTIIMYKTGIGSVTAYDIVVTVTDQLTNATSRTVHVPTVEIPFVIDPAMPAVGVGAVPQNTRMLELASNWRLKTGGGIFQYQTNDILVDALTVSYGCSIFEGTGAAYTGSVPGDYSAYKYGSFLVFRRSSTITEVLAIPYLSTYGMALNTYYSGTWSGWSLYMRNASIVTDDMSSGAVTIAANNHATVNITVTKADYTPIGVVGITWSGSSYPVLAGYKLTSSTNLAIYVVNPTSSSMSVTKYTASILYKANY